MTRCYDIEEDEVESLYDTVKLTRLTTRGNPFPSYTTNARQMLRPVAS